MGFIDVRRLAAVDMYGGAGSRTRRRIILLEFILGAIGCLALGLWGFITFDAAGWRVFGAWLAGVGLNYVPLALHAISLSPAGRLEAELDGVDVGPELRHYSAAQFWIFVPALIAVLGGWQGFQRRRGFAGS